MTRIPLGEERSRKDKICSKCKWFMDETATLEGECAVDEDIESTKYCESFESERGGR